MTSEAIAVCACGCGSPAPLAPHTNKRRGWVKGAPLRYVHGHNTASPVETRFWNRVIETPSGCWEWQGTRNEHGYGGVSVEGKWRKAHQVAWELTHGERPPGVGVLHTCDNPPCVNPAHLFLGTQAENVQDMIAKGRAARGSDKPRQRHTRTHCPQGHAYEGDNILVDGAGYWRCRACLRARRRKQAA
jgi:hypothetical protein